MATNDRRQFIMRSIGIFIGFGFASAFVLGLIFKDGFPKIESRFDREFDAAYRRNQANETLAKQYGTTPGEIGTYFDVQKKIENKQFLTNDETESYIRTGTLILSK